MKVPSDFWSGHWPRFSCAVASSWAFQPVVRRLTASVLSIKGLGSGFSGHTQLLQQGQLVNHRPALPGRQQNAQIRYGRTVAY